MRLSVLSVAVMRRHKQGIAPSARHTLNRLVARPSSRWSTVTTNILILVAPQLEQTVTKLQTALGFTPDQVAALPPPLAKIRELEQDNNRLQKENDDLRRMLSDAGRVLPLEVTRRNSLTSFHDTRVCDRDFKRRKMSENGSELYMVRRNMLPKAAPVADQRSAERK